MPFLPLRVSPFLFDSQLRSPVRKYLKIIYTDNIYRYMMIQRGEKMRGNIKSLNADRSRRITRGSLQFGLFDVYDPRQYGSIVYV